jgi:hypothetical protein
LEITAGESGTGSESVSFTVTANPGPARQGTLTIAGRTYTVTQDGAPCTYSLSAAGATLGAAGGVGSVEVTTSNVGCPWTAVSSAPEWLAVTAGAAGTGSGTVAFAVGANAGALRTATLTIAGKTFTVTQDSPPCTYSIRPGSASFPALGGTGTVTVTANYSSCPWEAVSLAPSWLTVTAGATGTGSGSVTYALADNPGEPRSGELTIAGRSFTVTQGKHGPAVRRVVPRSGT